MGKSAVTLHNRENIEGEIGTLKHSNAFIMPDGTFYPVKGYTGSHPFQQLESASLEVLKKEIECDISKAECEYYLQRRNINYKARLDSRIRMFYHLRSVLVHYYGYALFAREESLKYRGSFYDRSMVPNPEYYGKDVTSSQIETLGKLFEINDDGTVYYDFMTQSNQDLIQKVLRHEHDCWHI